MSPRITLALLAALAAAGVACGGHPAPAPDPVTTPPSPVVTFTSVRPSPSPTRPTVAPTSTRPIPTDPTSFTPALTDGNRGFTCSDGTISHAQHRQGACSHHGGVR